MIGPVTARRHWGAFHTPWVVRKLRKRAAPDTRLPEAYRFDGSAEDADAWVSRLLVETNSFDPARDPQGAPRRVEATDVLELLADLPAGGGGLDLGGGADLSWLNGPDELAMVIFGVVAVVLVLAVAVPLGLVAIELLVTLAVIAAGVVARLVHIKPWTVLVRRGETIVAAVAVTGWRPSGAVIQAVRRHNG